MRIFPRQGPPDRSAQGSRYRAISGAVGTLPRVDPRIEAHVLARMGLTPEPISTQVIPRDRQRCLCDAGRCGVVMERWAVEIRHLQRTEVLEAEEFFSEAIRALLDAAQA